MTLKDTMAADWAALTSADDFGQTVTVTPADQVNTFTIAMVLGDPAETYGGVVSGTDQVIRCDGHCRRSLWRAGVQTATGAAADPKRGDLVTVAAADPYAGAWYVDSIGRDIGDGLIVHLVQADQYQVGAEGAAQRI
jgi:hypothetical protein